MIAAVDDELEAGALARALDLPEPARRLLQSPQGDGEVDHAMAGVLKREEGRAGADHLVVGVGSEVQDGEHASMKDESPRQRASVIRRSGGFGEGTFVRRSQPLDAFAV